MSLGINIGLHIGTQVGGGEPFEPYIQSGDNTAGAARHPDDNVFDGITDLVWEFDGVVVDPSLPSRYLISRDNESTQRQFYVRTFSDNKVQTAVRVAGATQPYISDAGLFVPGVRNYVKFERIASTGEGRYYTSDDDGATWTQFGPTVTRAPGAVEDTATMPLTVLARGAGTDGASVGASIGADLYKFRLLDGATELVSLTGALESPWFLIPPTTQVTS